MSAKTRFSRKIPLIHDAWDGLMDFAFPKVCALCREPCDDALCSVCLSSFPSLIPPVCPRCCRMVSGELQGALCSDCRAIKDPQLYRAIAPWSYDGGVRTAIHHLKFDGRKSVGRVLGDALGGYAERNTYLKRSVQMIIPVPLHWLRRWERGYNQSEILARQVALSMDVPLNLNVLIRKRLTHASYKLHIEERRKNMSGAFEVHMKEAVRGKVVMLVDDIITTMTTLEECARALKCAGAKRVYALALARD